MKKYILGVLLLIVSFGCVLFINQNTNNNVVASAEYCTVTFNFNKSRIKNYLPQNQELLSSINNVGYSVSKGNTIPSGAIPKPNKQIYYYYSSYDWTVDGIVVDVESYVINSNVIFEAVWTPKEYKVYYFYDSPDEMLQITNIQTVVSFNVETPNFNLYTPIRPNYIFRGWFKYGSDIEELLVENTSIGDKVVKASWLPIEYSINYHTDGSNLRNPTNYNVEDDTYILVPPTKQGHIFLGWYLDEDFTTQITEIVAGSSGNLDIYPKWELVEYNVKYVLPDGSTEIVKTKYGKTANLPSSIKTNMFKVAQTNVSRNNITGDTVIEIRIINIWWVYAIAVVLIAGIIVISIAVRKYHDNKVSNLRKIYLNKSKRK